MTAISTFSYPYSAATRDEGIELCKQIGQDMIPLDGYVSHQVVQDVADPGHMTVTTWWESAEKANATLAVYRHDPKILRTIELLGKESPGFVGDVVSSA